MPVLVITMKKTIHIFLIFLLSNISYVVADESLPPPFAASYKIFRKNIEVAKLDISLSPSENGEFIYRAETNSTGLAAIFYKLHILEESRWQLHEDQLQPLNYNYERIKKKKTTHKRTLFDWKSQQAHFTGDGTSSHFELEHGMTDKLLYQINIMRDLSMGNKPTTYTVVDGEKIKTYHFEQIGEELIKTPMGEFNTIKLIRKKPDEKEYSILWCATALHYLPIKVENTDDDENVTVAIINTLSGLGQPEQQQQNQPYLSARILSNSSGGM